MRKRRPRTAVTLIAMALVLLAAIGVGQRLGEKALFGSTERRVPLGGVLATPVANPTPSPAAVSRYWKREQVVSVATDPAFPDPRVTPPPTPTPPPAPRPRPARTLEPLKVEPDAEVYTSPPLPMPLLSHDPSEAAASPEPTLNAVERANVPPSVGAGRPSPFSTGRPTPARTPTAYPTAYGPP